MLIKYQIRHRTSSKKLQIHHASCARATRGGVLQQQKIKTIEEFVLKMEKLFEVNWRWDDSHI